MCEKTKEVQTIITKYGKAKENLLAILMDIQELSPYNYISEEQAVLVASELGIPFSKVHDVLTFYAMFSVEPRGKYVIEICKSSPCYVCKADAVVNMFEEALGIKLGETTPDKLFTLMYTSCVGACDIGPVAKIGEKIFGNLTKEKIQSIVDSYREVAECQK